jgi:uncharacterized protein YdaU (DUF1376 family)
MNFFPFHPGDYMLRTAHLEPLEDLAYRRLIDLYYVNEQPIQGQPEEVARVIRMRSNAAEVGVVLREFFVPTEEGWRHRHCDEVISQYHAKAKQAVENGKRGGRPRKSEPEPYGNPGKTKPVISGNPAETGSQANQEPITNNQEDQKNSLCAGEEIPLSDAGEQDFEPAPQPVDPKAPVEMTLDWVPDAKSLKTYCVHYGVSVDLFTPEAIAPFTAHHESSGGLQTQGKWVQMLVKWVKNDQNRASNVRPFPSKPAAQPASRHHGFAERDYTAGLKQREDGSYAL